VATERRSTLGIIVKDKRKDRVQEDLISLEKKMESEREVLETRKRQSLEAISLFISGLYPVTIHLLNSLLLILNSPLFSPRHFKTSALSRKRKRSLESDYYSIYFHILNNRDFLIRKKRISSEWYIKPRTIQFFYLCIDWMPYKDLVRFKAFFRFSPETFDYICEMVHDDLLTRPPFSLCTLPNRKLSVRRQVAIALRRLSTGDHILGISEMFGLSVTSVSRITWKFIQAFTKKGWRLITWPEGDDMETVKRGFLNRWNFPNCCGALDGTHFPIELPNGENSESYFDFKKKISVSMQGIVDLDLRFLHVCCGWPGSVQDFRLLRVSSFYKDVEERGTKLNAFEYFCSDRQSFLREYILGDAGYPLHPWLMTPFTQGRSPISDEWNHWHSQARICVERAFGVLKGVWRILSQKLIKPRKDRIGPLIFCCCLLHNLLIERKETIDFNLLDVGPHPPGYSGITVPRRDTVSGGERMRENLVNEVLTLKANSRN
jgi:hypothetical protein